MTDFQRGYCYGIYRKRVHNDQMLSQKLYGIFFSVMGTVLQAMVGTFEFILASACVMAMGIYLILTKRNYMKE